VVANQSLLVEHRPVAAEEAVLGRARHQPVVVLDGQADVEDLTAACNISIVAVVLALARECSGVVGAGFGRGSFVIWVKRIEEQATEGRVKGPKWPMLKIKPTCYLSYQGWDSRIGMGIKDRGVPAEDVLIAGS